MLKLCISKLNPKNMRKKLLDVPDTRVLTTIVSTAALVFERISQMYTFYYNYALSLNRSEQKTTSNGNTVRTALQTSWIIIASLSTELNPFLEDIFRYMLARHCDLTNMAVQTHVGHLYNRCSVRLPLPTEQHGKRMYRTRLSMIESCVR